MSKATLETAIRNDILARITELLSKDFDTDVMPVSASELTMPVVDAEGNEAFALVKVSIPRGTRNGEGGYTPYDGYKMAELYKEDVAAKEQKAKVAAEKKAAKIAADARKRKEKAEAKAARDAAKKVE